MTPVHQRSNAPLCVCGHAAQDHPAVSSIAGDYTTACLGCLCGDYEERISLRIAYADPPYPGQAKRWYGDHKDYAGEVDHAELVERLVTYDGWALSTSAAGLQGVLALCPEGVRVAVWYRQNSEHPGNRGTWWWSWEPVIVSPARAPEIATRDMLSHHKEQGFLGSTIPGQKPKAVCQWIFALVGLRPEDELDDLFPGSGAVTTHWQSWRSQLTLGAA